MRPPCLALFLFAPSLFAAQEPNRPNELAITLKITQVSGGATNHPLPIQEVRALAAKALSGESVQVVEANGATVADVDIEVRVHALKAPNGVFIYEISSTMAAQGVKPGPPSSLVGAVRDPAKVVEIMAGAAFDVVRSQTITRRPVPEKSSQTPAQLTAIRDTKAAGVELTQVKVRHQPAPPRYPRVAMLRRIQGTVRMEILISPDGLPESARVIEGPSALQMTALAYALEWTFEPSKLNAVPQWGRYKLAIPFTLPNEDGPNSGMMPTPDRGARGSFPSGPDPRH